MSSLRGLRTGWPPVVLIETRGEFLPDHVKRFYGGGMFRMLSQVLFHPYHIIPAGKLISALIKFTHKAIPEMFMEPDAVSGQVFVLCLGTGDTGIQIDDTLQGEGLFQRQVQFFPDALSFAIVSHI